MANTEIKSGTDFMTGQMYVGIRTTHDSLNFFSYTTGVKKDKDGNAVRGKFGKVAEVMPFCDLLRASGFASVTGRSYYARPVKSEEDKKAALEAAKIVAGKFDAFVAAITAGKVTVAEKVAPVKDVAALAAAMVF